MIDRRINVRGIILKDGQILAQQLTPDHHGRPRDFWCTPGGGLDAGESLHQGLEREMIEETGIKPVIGELLCIQQFNDGEQEQLEFFFNITNVDDYRSIDLSATSHGLAEIKRVEFVTPSAVGLLPKFLRDIDLQAIIDRQSPIYIQSQL